jgi:glycosyltransferase involved in cell wall biosynthesis
VDSAGIANGLIAVKRIPLRAHILGFLSVDDVSTQAGEHSSSKPRRRTVVVVSPALRYGSWSWFEDIIASSPDTRWIVIAYGVVPSDRLLNVEWLTWKMGDYLKIGRFATHRYFLWLNFVYVLPLAVVAWFVAWYRKADVVVGNGIAATVLLQPCRLFGQSEVWLGYHGYISWLGNASQKLMRLLLSNCSGAICNSQGSADDLGKVLPGRPVIPVQHWAADAFFLMPLAKKERDSGRFRVLYVGRTDPEKFAQCNRVMKQFAKAGIAELSVVGSAQREPIEDGIRYVGYVAGREALAEYYRWADLVWAPADVDDLSRPGVEALACGRPVLVSDIPAVGGKCDGSIRIPRSLVPDGVGWVVDGMDDREVVDLLERLASTEGPLAEPIRCRTYARDQFSSDNIATIAEAWSL